MRRHSSVAVFGLVALAAFACGGSSGDAVSGGSDLGGGAGAGDGAASNAAGAGDANVASTNEGIAGASASINAKCTGKNGGVAYSKYKTAFFGNLHQHTMNSLDAYSFGTRATPADAYLFAKKMKSIQVGSGTNAPAGPTVTIDRPLDFLAVTDHSEWLGIVAGCNDTSSSMYATSDCARVRSTAPVQQDLTFATLPKEYSDLCASGAVTAAECAAQQKTAWQDEQTAAKDAYEPCKFSSFVAFEWTSMINGDTNHRNVLFGSDTVPASPLDSNAYPTRQDLWAGLDAQCTGACSAIVAPHNSNLSGGLSLTPPASASEAASMEKYQRLVEIYQHKGDSECFYDPKAPSSDPDCAFEYVKPGAASDTPNSYVRTALETGIGYAAANGGANPLKLGIMASTDDHNAAAGLVAEDGYVGHLGRQDDTADKRLTSDSFSAFGPGGLAVAWAEENTRASIFDALMRRETYGVSGPRMQVRFYATKSASPCTADFPKTIIDANDAIPMGGTFARSDVGVEKPTFAIAAWPDPAPQPVVSGPSRPAGLAKAQIIKAHGTSTITEDPPVDLAIAPAGQCLTWTDASFDPNEQAFYYVRVLQEPTWRWSHFDCQGSSAAGCKPGGGLDVSIQERAWTSPIWYAP